MSGFWSPSEGRWFGAPDGNEGLGLARLLMMRMAEKKKLKKMALRRKKKGKKKC